MSFEDILPTNAVNTILPCKRHSALLGNWWNRMLNAPTGRSYCTQEVGKIRSKWAWPLNCRPFFAKISSVPLRIKMFGIFFGMCTSQRNSERYYRQKSIPSVWKDENVGSGMQWIKSGLFSRCFHNSLGSKQPSRWKWISTFGRDRRNVSVWICSSSSSDEISLSDFLEDDASEPITVVFGILKNPRGKRKLWEDRFWFWSVDFKIDCWYSNIRILLWCEMIWLVRSAFLHSRCHSTSINSFIITHYQMMRR